MVALRATVTLTYIPVMTRFLGLLGHFMGILDGFLIHFFGENIDIFAKIGSQIYRVSEVLLCV